ncbi:MAG TPA: glycosyltransferase [Candidatus Cybelea sp.]
METTKSPRVAVSHEDNALNAQRAGTATLYINPVRRVAAVGYGSARRPNVIRDAQPSIRIVIPAFNEGTRITSTLAQYCPRFGNTASILVVANGCSDDTCGVVRCMQKYFANLNLIEFPAKIGKGGAVRLGLGTGREEFVGFVDADGSTKAEEFERLYRIARCSNAQAVIGSRWLRGARLEPCQPLTRRLASRAFNGIVRRLFTLDLRDTQCGAKIFRRRALRAVLRELELCDFAADIEILWRLHRAGQTILEIPTVWSDKRSGSKVHLLPASWRMLKSVVYLRLRHSRLSNSPMLGLLRGSSVLPIGSISKALLFGRPGLLPS